MLQKETYIPGETATFECTCTTAGEENAVGNIVWRNSTNFILQNVSTNSGSCRTSIFSNSFIFAANSTLYSGNVTFETDDPTWGNIDDVVSDDFEVVNFTSSDCLIQNIETSSNIKVGSWGSVKFEVYDPTSGEAMVHASCNAEGLAIDGSPLIFIPEAFGDEGYKFTSAGGHVGFRHKLVESFWELNTSYAIELHCFSIPNSTSSDPQHVAYLQESGTPAGIKACETEITFTTNGVDLRPENTTTGQGLVVLGTILALLIGVIVLIALGAYLKWLPFKIFLISLGSLLLMFTIGYAASLDDVLGSNGVQGDSIGSLYVLSTIIILGGMIGLMLFLVILALDFFRYRRGLTTKFFGEREDDD